MVPSLYVRETPSTKVLSFTIEPAADDLIGVDLGGRRIIKKIHI
ncbi:hypothetical protein JMUB7543_28300 [Staphylococcus aureus]